MASTTQHSTFHAPAGQGFFARIGARIMNGMENHIRIASRRGLIEELEAKSDSELAQLGIRREDIAVHVFRDMFYA